MEDLLQRRMETIGGFPALTAIQVGVHHFADDRAGTDDRHLHHDVVKSARHHARQRGHLRAALHLKHGDGIGLLECVEDGRIVLRKMREVDRLAVGRAE